MKATGYLQNGDTVAELSLIMATQPPFCKITGDVNIEREEEGPVGLEFGSNRNPPPRPDQALLGCRRGPMKNKSNDPAAVILRSIHGCLGSQSKHWI